MLLQPLNSALELPPPAFVPFWAVLAIACVCLSFEVTPEGLSFHLTPERAKVVFALSSWHRLGLLGGH